MDFSEGPKKRYICWYVSQISFGGIPNSSSIDILMPYAIFDYMGGVLPMWTMLSPWSKQAHGCSCQGCKATNHTGTFRNLRNPATNRPEPSPNLASGTYTNIRRNSPPPEPSKTFRANLRQHTPEPSRTPKSSGTFRNWPPEPDIHHFTPELSGTYTSIRRNSPEPSGTYTSIRRNFPEPSGPRLQNLHQHTPELSGTFRNSPHAGTLRNLPEPASGTFRILPEPPCGTYSSTPQNPLEPSGTFLRNLLLRPAPAHTGAYLGWKPH